ncbi:MAG: hypothetical protein JXA73_06410 [Acidobacteria bacterium]|nr:hypothetical protein [Acidobacteriota bacterium]
MRKGAGLFLCLLLFVVEGAYGTAKEDGELLEVLLENGTITQEQYDKLIKEASQEDDRHVAVQFTTEGGLEASTYDGRFAFKLGGVFASDLAFYNENKNPLGNGTEIRSGRVEMEGTFFSNWDFEYSIEFADDTVEIKDAFLTYKGLGSLNLTFGHYKAPFSLEQVGSRRNLTFLERALPNVLVPDRKLGVGASYYGAIWTAAAGIFGETYNGDVDDEGDEGWTASGRFTLAPFHSDTRVLHLGASAAYQVPGDVKEVRFRETPESHLTDARYLNTGKIKNIKDWFTYGMESVIVYGPFSVQGEFIHSSLNRGSNNDNPAFNGGYVFGSWMITGESRDYKFKKGAFGRITPDRTYGALELAVRYSVLDLNSPPETSGGRQDNVTFALNWYINRNVRLMTNYILANNDSYATDNGDLYGDDDIHIFQARLQVHF